MHVMIGEIVGEWNACSVEHRKRMLAEKHMANETASSKAVQRFGERRLVADRHHRRHVGTADVVAFRFEVPLGDIEHFDVSSMHRRERAVQRQHTVVRCVAIESQLVRRHVVLVGRRRFERKLIGFSIDDDNLYQPLRPNNSHSKTTIEMLMNALFRVLHTIKRVAKEFVHTDAHIIDSFYEQTSRRRFD